MESITYKKLKIMLCQILAFSHMGITTNWTRLPYSRPPSSPPVSRLSSSDANTEALLHQSAKEANIIRRHRLLCRIKSQFLLPIYIY